MIGFVGLSHLGINYSHATIAKGFKVLAYDENHEYCNDLRKGVFPIQEPGLTDLYTAHNENISYTSSPADLRQCDIIFFALDISTDKDNNSDTSYLEKLVEQSVPHTKKGVTLIFLSQVPPGWTRLQLSKIRQLSKNNIKAVYYQVETLIFGCAVERALYPERYIIGCESPKECIPTIYQEWLDAFRCPILPMRYESAELTKISINMFLASIVTTTNTLAELCEKIGANWSEIIPALKLDKRIGKHAYIKPGLGISGGNLERDLVTISKLSKKHKTESGVVKSIGINSLHRKEWLYRTVSASLEKETSNKKVAILGLSYKEETNSIKNSPSINLVKQMPEVKKHVYDPMVKIQDNKYTNLTQSDTAIETCQDSDILVIATPWEEFKDFNLCEASNKMSGKVIIDPFAVLNYAEVLKYGFEYKTLGK